MEENKNKFAIGVWSLSLDALLLISALIYNNAGYDFYNSIFKPILVSIIYILSVAIPLVAVTSIFNKSTANKILGILSLNFWLWIMVVSFVSSFDLHIG